MNLQENIRRILKKEKLKQILMDEIMESGIRDTANFMSVDVKELLRMVGIIGTKEDMIFLTKAIMENEVKEELNYCSYNIVPTLHSIKLYVYIPKPLPKDVGIWSRDQRVCDVAEELISDWLYDLGDGLIRGYYIHVSNTGDC
jgi:hypothetical protein